MRSAVMLSSFLALLATVLPHLASASVSSYIASEGPIARAGMLANIGPNGSKSSGAAAGVVIASPNTVNPNYLYTWVRDSSLVFKSLIDQYTLGIDQTPSLRTLIDQFITAESNLQQTSNPSGTVSTGGLGEPKFNIDESAFTGSWGRPQRDGPALRATAVITYANWLIANGNSTYVTSKLWPIIELDLNYVSANWNQTSFDLWEELQSSSFWTTAVQHRALREGITLANAIKQTSVVSGWTTQANAALCFLQSYWGSGYITANTGGGRSGIDSNTVLASIHTFDIAAGCDATTFQPCSDRALANLLVYVNSFRTVYALNSGVANNVAVATGRYPEDVYQGGNPWYLCTLAVAEQLYDALHTWSSIGSLSITSTSLPFFKTFLSSAAVGTYASSTSTYSTLTSAIQTYADGFVNIVAEYTPSNGGLAEQFSRTNGAPLSALDLTWSYASALTAFEARNSTTFKSWGAKGLTAAASCQTGPAAVAVTFVVDATTVLGENIYLTGSVASLENWSTTSPLLLSSANYPEWSITVDVPAGTTIQYKYIRINNGALTWESDPNNQITTPASGTYTTADTWR
ncbi:hypothetical protein HWV62_3364 [Athelia sp. TMB]|nr:hypothetical protein HWV62_3364 [Athelia sp. TMB]